MTKRLTLKTDHLAELTSDELQLAVGAAYTGQVGCALSLNDPCVSAICVGRTIYTVPCGE